MDYTEHYALKLPGPTEYAKVTDLNENAVTIDGELHVLETGQKEINRALAARPAVHVIASRARDPSRPDYGTMDGQSEVLRGKYER